MPEGRTRGQTTAQTSDTGGVAQQLTSARQSYPSTLSVRRRRRRDQSSLPVHGFPLALLGYHPRLRMVRLRRRRQLLCTAMTMAVEAEQWWSIDRAVGGVGHRLYIDFFRCV